MKYMIKHTISEYKSILNLQLVLFTKDDSYNFVKLHEPRKRKSIRRLERSHGIVKTEEVPDNVFNGLVLD